MESNSESPLLTSKHDPKNAHLTGDVEDIPPINRISDFFIQFGIESKKLWYLAGPAIFTTVCQYSLDAVTQTFAGNVGTLYLVAVYIENLVIASFALGIMVGMGSALERLCGQAFGAGQVDMLGVYMKRSWVILFVTGLIMMFLYIFATPLLLLIRQTEDISHAAGKMALWMIPQLFAYAFNYPIAKFLQAQSKIMVMAYISAAALVMHTFFSWLLMLKLGWGLWGGALVLNLSWWFMVIAQMMYILSGTYGRAWSGFSWGAFSNLWSFVKLSFASAIMLCLETWYFMALVLFAGYLKNAEIAVDALSIWYPSFFCYVISSTRVLVIILRDYVFSFGPSFMVAPLHFRGFLSLEPVGLPCFKRALDSFIVVLFVFPSGTSIIIGAFKLVYKTLLFSYGR